MCVKAAEYQQAAPTALQSVKDQMRTKQRSSMSSVFRFSQTWSQNLKDRAL